MNSQYDYAQMLYFITLVTKKKLKKKTMNRNVEIENTKKLQKKTMTLRVDFFTS